MRSRLPGSRAKACKCRQRARALIRDEGREHELAGFEQALSHPAGSRPDGGYSRRSAGSPHRAQERQWFGPVAIRVIRGQRPLTRMDPNVEGAGISALVQYADSVPYRNRDVAYAGQVEQITPTRVSGWAVDKDAARGAPVSVRLGAHEISNSRPTVSRPDVAAHLNSSDTVFGFGIFLDTRRALEILAARLASAQSAPIPLTVSMAQPLAAERRWVVLPTHIPFESQRTPEDWLDFFGFAIDPEILAARTLKYDRIVRVAQPATDEWRAELFLSSMVSKSVLGKPSGGQGMQNPRELVQHLGPSSHPLPLDADFIAKVLRVVAPVVV